MIRVIRGKKDCVEDVSNLSEMWFWCSAVRLGRSYTRGVQNVQNGRGNEYPLCATRLQSLGVRGKKYHKHPACDFTQAGSLPAAGGAKGDQGLTYSRVLKTDSRYVQRVSKLSELFKKLITVPLKDTPNSRSPDCSVPLWLGTVQNKRRRCPEW